MALNTSVGCIECGGLESHKKCEVCWTGICETCYKSKRLFVEWIDEPTQVFRVYRCSTHISTPLRFYDVVAKKEYVPDDYNIL